jgi:hypothetical protein
MNTIQGVSFPLETWKFNEMIDWLLFNNLRFGFFHDSTIDDEPCKTFVQMPEWDLHKLELKKYTTNKSLENLDPFVVYLNLGHRL